MDLLWVDVLGHQRGGHGFLVDSDAHAATVLGDLVSVLAAIVKDRDGAEVVVPPRIVLVDKIGGFAVGKVLEVVPLAAQHPEDLAGGPGDVRDAVRVSGRDEIVPFVVLGNAVDVIPIKCRIAGFLVCFIQCVMLRSTPFKEQMASRQVDFLDQAVPYRTVLLATNGGEIVGYGLVHGYQNSTILGDETLVQIAVKTIHPTELVNLFVAGIKLERHLISSRFS